MNDMPEVELPLAGRVALVTGGASGIGRASVLAFARAGARVVISDVSVSGGEETVDQIRVQGGESCFIQADVSNGDQVATLIAQTVDRFGRLDFAHNNAGIEGDIGDIVACNEENWDRVIDVNLKGIWLCLKSEISQMLKQGHGAIVNTASVSGLRAYPPNLPAYVARKFGVVGLTRAAALSYAGQGIRINAVCPGAIDTPMLDRISQSSARLGIPMVAENPVGRLGGPGEVANAVVWLCSEAASFVIGQTLVVDGGFLA